ncbi:MAG TPA: hypothetical protein VM099_16765 [Gemmatimonadaceae bacterium]|nr:hypothetical protein [Gemmatimonadaceae bacterium]
MRCWTVYVLFLMTFVMVTRGSSAQVSGAGDLDPTGRVLAKIRVRLTEPTGAERAVTAMPLALTSEAGETTPITTDDAGIATAWLAPGNYRVTTGTPVTWSGRTYSWDLLVAVTPGMGPLTLSEANASPDKPTGEIPVTEPRASQPSTSSPDPRKLRIYVDCQSGSGCDLDYFKSEIGFVDYMRDRADAFVHLLITSQPNGGGGVSYTLNFIGQRSLTGMRDTAALNVPETSTQDERRTQLAQRIRLGLVRYVVRLNGGENLSVSFKEVSATRAQASNAAHDPWNLWVFQASLGGDFSGEESRGNYYMRGSTSANRNSEEWKFHLRVSGDYSEARYTLSDNSKYESDTHSYGANHLLVKSLGAHWGVGERASMSSSTYLNQKLFLAAAPTVEVNLFPYSQSTRRLFTLAYSVGLQSYQYEDTTVLNKISEVRYNQSINGVLSQKQPWGSVYFSFEAAAFLDDFTQRHARMYNELGLRLYKGLSLNTYFSISWFRDQLSLAKGELTDEEILLQRRQLASTYSYYGGVGLSYTFGSIFNNVVNPRFEVFK